MLSLFFHNTMKSSKSDVYFFGVPKCCTSLWKNIYSFNFWFHRDIFEFWRVLQSFLREVSCRKITLPSTFNLLLIEAEQKRPVWGKWWKVHWELKISESPMDNFCRFWTLEIVTKRFLKNQRLIDRFIWCVQRMKVRCYLLAYFLMIIFRKN